MVSKGRRKSLTNTVYHKFLCFEAGFIGSAKVTRRGYSQNKVYPKFELCFEAGVIGSLKVIEWGLISLF